MRRWVLLLVGVLLVVAAVLYFRVDWGLRLGSINLPTGFEISFYVSGVDDARSLALGDRGTLFVGTRQAGLVYALRDTNRDFTADIIDTIARGLRMPNGVAFYDGALYVAETERVIRFDAIETRLDTPPTPFIVLDGLPNEAWHGWRYLRVGPDAKLYLSVGAPCNVCDRGDDERLATILRMNPDGSNVEVFARGVRNSVGFDWHPVSGDLWFTDNGRDWLGNNEPPDELNRAAAPGRHFGFPVCHGGTIVDEEFGAGQTCETFEPPVQPLGPHVAALGMRFYTGEMFPREYYGQVFIAEHGSWNRIPPSGYRITRVRLEGDAAIEYSPFASGWLKRGRAAGRPTDLLTHPDGSLLVSDDKAGVIYRIIYTRR